MQFKSIKTKIVVMAGICLIATIAVLLIVNVTAQKNTQSFVSNKVHDLIEAQTKRGLLSVAKNQASQIQEKLATNLDAARTLSEAFKAIRMDYSNNPDMDIRELLNDILLTTLKDNSDFLGTYSAWEPNALDGNDMQYAGDQGSGHDDTGRFVPYWNRDEQGNIARQALVGYEDSSLHPNGVQKGGWYLRPKEKHKENILDPFPYIVQGKQEWLTTMSAPIMEDGKFLGIAGTDLRLNFIQQLCEKVAADLYDGAASVQVISNLGVVVASSKNPDTVGKPLKDVGEANWQRIVEATKAAESFVDLGEEGGVVKVQAPIIPGRTEMPWSVYIEVPHSVVFAQANELDRDMDANLNRSILIGVGVAGAVAVLACAILWFLAGTIVTPVRKSVRFAESIAEGDFEQKLEINQKDEIGVLANSLRTMATNLKAMIAEAGEKTRVAEEESDKAQVAMQEAHEAKERAESAKAEGMLQAAQHLEEVVEVLTSASEELSAQIEQSSRGSDVQSQRVSETASAMEQMNATVLEVAKSAAEAASTADSAKGKAQEGSDVVTQVVQGIGEVQDQALDMKSDMTSLGEQAESIGRILDVISDIADQTNLLALNAAIEAARAGEAGRGFAVVADEVRKLAEKTMTATKEVGDAIHGIQNGTKRNIHNVEQAVSKIDSATGLAQKSGSALSEIVQLVDLTTDQVNAIAAASEEQSAASDEINRSIEEVNQISAENSDAMRQSALAVTELAHQAQVLKDLIEQMKSESTASAG
ncbi:methyl-accepting chemotaxis protein [Oceanidesulfovibrio marinus]|uniref:HAMP domain-containing protein n=1 Tax=Oceanidesulfovibrio marinus TaxID=370038 RepID=A0ABX6NIQ4_9BACT|nr:methyl-accepting chemotaxis protein [Oceanidesulfovibrio marinus]QJT10529.1 HAMP domain-containing protein [Oceanidesulfovibrio marinus]